MRSFINKVLKFLLPIIAIIIIGLFLPTTPRASKSLLMASIAKDSLLLNQKSPRIIFVGGSNLSFGLNSQIIKDSLGLNPINTGIHAAIGVKYMMDNTLEYIQNEDIVILVPEYYHYYKNINQGSEELLRVVFDVDIMNIKHLNAYQVLNVLPFMPKYTFSKFKWSEYRNYEESDIYSVNSFNEYGDTFTHWEKSSEKFTPDYLNGEFNDEVLRYFEKFNSEINEKGASLFVSFPGFQASSYDNSIDQIKNIEHKLKNSNLKILGTASRYKIADSLMFNSSYHLNKRGVDYRTNMLIEDIRRSVNFL